MGPAEIRDIEQLVKSELLQIGDEALRNALRAYLLTPTRQMRRWDYGSRAERFPCWLVAEFLESRTGIVYCERGFGPDYPWGIVDLDDDAIGMDASWHISMEHAFRNSPPWAGRNPPGYEVP